MNYDISNDDAVMNDINTLKSHIDLRKIFIDVNSRGGSAVRRGKGYHA